MSIPGRRSSGKTLDLLAKTIEELSRRLGEPEGEPAPLDGGITNRNFRARFGGTDVVIRLPGKDTEKLSIDRGAERIASEAAARVGVGPEVEAMLERPALPRHPLHRGGADDVRGAPRAGDAGRGRRRAARRPRRRRAPGPLRLVPDRRGLRREGDRARRDPPRRLRVGALRRRRGRGGAERPRARAGPLPRRPPRRQLPPLAGRDPDRRLGVRGDGGPLLRPRQLRRQQRPRRRPGDGPARRLFRPSPRRRPGSPRCG